MTSWFKEHSTIQAEVRQALENGTPIVALESTVITHGLPFPENTVLARGLEAEVRKRGSIPATIAILEGEILIGLDEAQLDRLVDAENVMKVSSRDIAAAVEKRKNGGTTVAGTLAVANGVGIKVFATGGIGGVHRNAPFDISADLGALGRTPLVVVCAGVKAILDIAATLELLETLGVPVVGYQTDEFPAFYSVSSGSGVSCKVDSAEEAAKLARIHWAMGMKSAILVVVPPPAELAMENEEVEFAIKAALEEAQKKEIRGQAVTPFLLKKVSELTGGASLQANLGLLRNNARVAAEIAHFLR